MTHAAAGSPLDTGLGDDAFEYRFGTSVLTEFALAHTPADVLRELVQNEYDATGTAMEVAFGDAELTVTGNGSTIDEKGWRRLSVMLGTGNVSGSGGVVDAKTNGIGSKNFGLRSLFLFGDEIEIRSGGRYTVLDRNRGALREPGQDPSSAGRTGVTVGVRYRERGENGLPAFGLENEEQALADIAHELAPTLIKLAQPGAAKSVNRVVVRSERTGGYLEWHQRVRAVDSRTPAVLRSVRVRQVGSRCIPDVPDRVDEIEYHRVVRPPAGLRPATVPAYYRRGGGWVLLGISLPLRRQRLDLDAAGSFFYPLGAKRSRTGFPFSVNAPFTMNEDRSQIVDTINSPWNAWLLAQAAAFAVDLLPGDLYPRYGPDSYRAMSPGSSISTAPALVTAVEELLRTAACWPTRARKGTAKAPRLAAASAVLFGADTALDTFAADAIGEHAMLASDLAAHLGARAVAATAGAKTFTVNSLVRLRCAGRDKSGLATEIHAIEADYHYTRFPDYLASPTLQTSFAKALDAVAARLSDANRGDLATSPTTLAEDGSLRGAQALWTVPDSARGAVLPDEALHRGLAGTRVLPRLGRRFDLSTWARETAEKVQAGDGGDPAREALLQCVRTAAPLNAAAVAAVRRAPFVTDQRGDHVAPSDTVLRTTRGAHLVSDAVSFMPAEDEKNPGFARLRPRSKLLPDDLLSLARLVESGRVAPAVLRRALCGLPRLLAPNAVKAIGNVRCLETADGALAAPRGTYLPGSRAAQVLGPAASIPVGLPTRLLARLGSRADPSLADVVTRLRHLRVAPGAAAPPDALYAAALDAARRERTNLNAYRDEPLIWTPSGWHAPDHCLLGQEHKNIFLDAVPVLAGPLRDVHAALGAHRRPQPKHWRALLLHVGERHGHRALAPAPVRRALLRAYRTLDAVPDGVPPATRCLLDRDGALRSISDAAKRKLLVNDDPQLADAVTASGADVRFADTADPLTWPFWAAAGAQRLTTVARETGTAQGPPSPPPPGVRPHLALGRLHEPAFASAVAALAAALLHPAPAPSAAAVRRRLTQRTAVSFAECLHRQYALPGGVAVTTTAEYQVRDDDFVIAKPRSRRDFEIILCRAVTWLLDPSQQAERALADPLYVLLQCRSEQELQRELARRRVAWQPDPHSTWTADPDGDEDDGDDPTGADAVAAALRDAVRRDAESGRVNRRPPPSAVDPPAARPPSPPLPQLDDVRPRDGSSRPPARRGGGSGGGRGGAPASWRPRTPAEQEADADLGRHAERVVLRQERARLATRGLPPETAVWTAAAYPAADHDILSVDADGEPLYIEVKATRGRDGRFSWPIAEFRLAVQQRRRYVLYRVYEAETLTPTVTGLVDPVGALSDGGLAIDVETLEGDVGLMAAGDPEDA